MDKRIPVDVGLSEYGLINGDICIIVEVKLNIDDGIDMLSLSGDVDNIIYVGNIVILVDVNIVTTNVDILLIFTYVGNNILRILLVIYILLAMDTDILYIVLS
mgnify:CR=1 FL=1